MYRSWSLNRGGVLKEPRSGRFFGNFRLKLNGPARFDPIGVFRDSGHIRSPDLEIPATE